MSNSKYPQPLSKDCQILEGLIFQKFIDGIQCLAGVIEESTIRWIGELLLAPDADGYFFSPCQKAYNSHELTMIAIYLRELNQWTEVPIMFKTVAEKEDYIKQTHLKEEHDHEEVMIYVCSVCGDEYAEDLSTAINCCSDDCSEQLEERQHDFDYDQWQEESA